MQMRHVSNFQSKNLLNLLTMLMEGEEEEEKKKRATCKNLRYTWSFFFLSLIGKSQQIRSQRTSEGCDHCHEMPTT